MSKKRSRKPVFKARVLDSEGEEREVSNAVSSEEGVRLFEEAGAIEPPYPPDYLVDLYEDSSAVRPNVDAYESNVDAGGHHYEPYVDLTGDDAREEVRAAMWEEERLASGGEDVAAPTDAEVDARVAELADEARVERFRLDAFFSACTAPEDFTVLRRRTRVDLESTGNGYWEVLRDGAGKVAQFNQLPVTQMRLLPSDVQPQEVRVPVRATPITVVERTQFRRFRRYVQVVGQTVVYFKEFGDVRTVSSKSGKYYRSVDELAKEEPGVAPATEVAHFKIYSPNTPYGVPRWVGNLVGVLGSMEADQSNYIYFENRSVPPLAVLVTGGRMSAQSEERIRQYWQEVKGKRNSHKILVIEALPGEGVEGLDSANGRMKIELKPLTQAQLSDGQFLKYDERNAEKLGSSFRLPRLLRGDVRDFNRNTGELSLQLAETQIFGPARAEFDSWVNRFVLPSLGIVHIRYESNATRLRDPQVLATIIANLTRVGALVPADARVLASDYVFFRKLGRIDADWVRQPIMLTQAGVGRDLSEDGSIPAPGVGGGDGEGRVAEGAEVPAVKRLGSGGGGRLRLEAAARELVLLRDELSKVEAEGAAEEFAAARDEGVDVVKMRASEMVERFAIVPSASPGAARPGRRRGARR